MTLTTTPLSSTIFFCCLSLVFFRVESADPYHDTRGQPELQQAMDNAPILSPFDVTPPFPSGRGRGYPLLLTEKTSTLLTEALHMLHRVKDVKERRWVEAFIHRLGSLAADLEESTARSKSMELKTKVIPPTVRQEQFSSPFVSSSASKISKPLSKYQVTSAQLNEVIPINEGIARQVVTKPGMISKTSEDDFVLQLHNQDQAQRKLTPLDLMAPYDNQVTYHTRPLDSTSTLTVTSPTTPLHLINHVNNGSKEKERKTLITKLLEKMNDLKHLGGTQEELMNAFKRDNHLLVDFTNPEFRLDQRLDSSEQANEFEIEEDDEEEDGAAFGELEDEDNTDTSTVAPSWQQVLEAATAESRSNNIHQQQQPPPPHTKINSLALSTASNLPENGIKIDDELERQLRAGKIVVLSNSLVRTNFHTPTDTKDKKQPVSIENAPKAVPSTSPSKQRDQDVSSAMSRRHSSENDGLPH